MSGTISDVIEEFLLNAMGQNELLSICRNDLASHFSCAPSQINYVLMTRFTLDRGFVIRSKRGGGGSITIFRSDLNANKQNLIKDLEQGEGRLSQSKAFHITDGLQNAGAISEREAAIIKAAMSDRAIRADPLEKLRLRHWIFWSILGEILRK